MVSLLHSNFSRKIYVFFVISAHISEPCPTWKQISYLSVLGKIMLCLATLVCIGLKAAMGDNEIFLF